MREVTHEEAVRLAEKLGRERQDRGVQIHHPVTIEEVARIIASRKEK
jgi:hypothetical protein